MDEDNATQDMPADMPLPKTLPPEKPAGPAGRIIGAYEVRGVLGRGGMGVVYRACQPNLNREVALKMLTGHYGISELQRFLAEAQTAAALHHTNIVHIYEVGESDGAPFFSMEFVEGGSLADRLRKTLPTPRETAALLATVARALHFAHQHGVVHRDMKPANILLDPDGVPKVADFGIAKRLDNDSQLTRSGAIVGTPTYMAPEQAGGTSRDVGPAADVYSLGAILYEMLTGRPPFLPEESETAITLRVLTEETISPAWHRPETPRELEVICMKCLQKDPRDRYASAAAFAEDLRRYLDDEPIIARPPSRVMRTVKWVRRHPWKSVARVAMLVLVAFGSYRLWQWEFYQRQHIEYAVNMDHKFGYPVPAGSVSAAEVAHRGNTLRLTRRGRWGSIVRVESINSQGHPGILRELFGYDPLPNLIEGLLDAQKYAQSMRETTVVDYLYENGSVIQATGCDSSGIVNWRTLYNRGGSADQGQACQRYVTYRGFEFNKLEGASFIEFSRDSTGRDTKANFFGASNELATKSEGAEKVMKDFTGTIWTIGPPAANNEGVYGYAFERDAAGRVIRLINLDKDGKPGPNRLGQISLKYQRNDRQLITRIDFMDAAAEPTLWQGIAAFVSDYDAAGNVIRMTRLGLDGRPANGKSDHWAVEEIARNDRGEATEMRYQIVGPAGQLLPGWKTVIAYDEHGYPVDKRYEGGLRGHVAFQHDERGNILEEKFLGPNGQPIASKDGWAIHRHSYQFSADGTRDEETWFDAQGGPTYDKSGEHRRICEFDATGNLRRYITEEHDPARFSYQRYVSEPTFDSHGRLTHTHIQYQDAHGQPVVNSAVGYKESEDDLDEDGREIISWQIGWDEKFWGASVWRIDTEWYTTGIMHRRIQQACDGKRRPLSKVSTTKSARIEEEFDTIGRLQRRLETGFDPERVGYFSQELRFLGGKFDRVVYLNEDGSPVKKMRVLVRAILDKAQPHASDLRVGDQLVTANGEPVNSMYDWTQGTNFAGGYLEVMRDGKMLRIEGFQAGTIGVLLEDRVRKRLPVKHA